MHQNVSFETSAKKLLCEIESSRISEDFIKIGEGCAIPNWNPV
jgi:hypothetical protein